MNELAHIKAQLRDIGEVCQAVWHVWHCKTRVTRDEFDLKWYVMVQYMFQYPDMINYYHICPCIISFDQFWHILSGLIMLGSRCQVSAKMPGNGP